MSESLSRTTFEGALSVRNVEERLIEGRLVPFDEQIKIGGHEERFDPGALKTVGTVKFLHEHREVIGKMVSQETRSEGEYATFKVSQTQRGDDVLELAKDGVLGLSLGFVPQKSRMEGRARVHEEVSLLEVSAVGFPAYQGAEIMAVRSQEDQMPEVEKTQDTPEVVETREESLDVDKLVADIDAKVEKRMREFVAQPPEVEEIKEERSGPYLLQQLTKQALGVEYDKRALADVVSDLGTADASGLTPDFYWPGGLQHNIDRRRPIISASGSAVFPDYGNNLTSAKVTQEVVAGAENGQKVAIDSQVLIVDPTTYPIMWSKSGVDIAYELIAQSNPDVLTVVANSMLRAIAAKQENDHETAATAAGVHSGAVLDVTSYATLVGDIITESNRIEDVTGLPGDRLAVGIADWIAILSLMDGGDRRQFSVDGVQNSDGSGLLTTRGIDVGGVFVFYSAAVGINALQYNETSLRVAERSPFQISADNVELMGQDRGMLAAHVTVTWDEGITTYAA